MLTKYDEMLCHQFSSTFDHPGTSAREWTERIWFMAHDIKGDHILVAGFGYYPNRNIMDAFVCLAVEHKTQHVVRASRELRPRIDEVNVGPFSWDVIQPMKKVRAALAENEYGVSYDIVFDATMPPFEENPPQFFRNRGRVVEDINRYFQVGRPSGWIKVGGKTVTLDPHSWRTLRDHSWGIRRGAMDYLEGGVQPGEFAPGYYYNGACWEFENWGASYHIREGWDGTVGNFSGGQFYPFATGKEVLKLASIEHKFTFHPNTPGVRLVNGGSVVLNAVDGSKKQVTIRPLGVIYIGTGGYSYRNYRGFTHGMWMGPSWMDGFELDITNPEVRQEITYLDELACEVRCGDEVGYGLTEVSVMGKYPKYGFEGF
jgi:hypothetical protein